AGPWGRRLACRVCVFLICVRGRRDACPTDYANSSLITLPLLAIFIGRPLLLVNVVSSEMPRALQTVAMTSCEVYGSVSTAVPSSFVFPTVIPVFRPAPPTTTLQARAQ